MLEIKRRGGRQTKSYDNRDNLNRASLASPGQDGLRPLPCRQHRFGQGVCGSPPRKRLLSSTHHKLDHSSFRLSPRKSLALPRRSSPSPISSIISICNFSAASIRDPEFSSHIRLVSFHFVSMATDIHTKAAPLAVHNNTHWHPCAVFPLRRTLVLLHLQS